MVLLSGGLFWLAIISFPDDINQFHADFVIAQFIKGPLLIQIFALVLWFIQSIKPIPARTSEFEFLLSLPVKAKQILVQFLISDFIRYSWILFILSGAFLLLTPISTVAFLSRPILLSTNFFLLNIGLSTFLNIMLFSKGYHPKANYLSRLNPFVQGIIFVAHGGILLLSILIPIQVTDWLFWIIFLIQLILLSIIIFFSSKLFSNLQMKNSWFKTSAFLNDTNALPSRKHFRFWTSRLNRYPMLTKNIIQGWRSNTQVSNLVLACGFITIAYFLAMNNPIISDRISVLLGITILFEIFYSVRIIQRLNPELESTKIIFSLPIKKSQQYFSILLPGLLWCVILISIMTLYLIFWNSGFLASGWYFIKSIFAALLFVCTAVNFGLAGYPDLNAGTKKFAYWIFLLFVSMAYFYSYRFEVAVLFGLISFFFILKIERFQTVANLTKQSFV